MKKTFLALVLVFGIFSISSIANAAEVKNPYSSYISGLEKITSARHVSSRYVLLYEDGEAVYAVGIEGKGVAQEQASGKGYDSMSTFVGSEGSDDEGYEVKMDFVRKDETIYLRFPKATDKGLKNKWILVPNDEYAELGEAMNLSRFFELADVSNVNESELQIQKKSVALAEKYNIFKSLGDPTVKGKKAKMTITYEMEYDPANLSAYYTDLESQLTEEEKKKSIFATEGFTEGSKNKFFIKSLSESSYIAITFNAQTMLPVSYVERIEIPSFGKRKEVVQLTSYAEFSKINKKVKITVPKKTVSIEDALGFVE